MKIIRRDNGGNTKKAKLFRANPFCHWCGRLMRRYEPAHGRLPNDAATIDHLESKLLARFRGKKGRGGEVVLACHGCNQRRNVEEHIRFNGCKPTPPWRPSELAQAAMRRAAAICGIVPRFVAEVSA